MAFRRLLHIGPIIALFVTFSCYTVSIIDSYVWLLPPQKSTSGILNLLVLTIWLALILRNFFSAVFLGPGFVPNGWRPSEKENEGKLQYCQVCKGYKPPRSHHCRTCKRCVMKMDHHCPWINTCCGHANHTSFLYFLFFAPVGCLHAAIVIVITLCYQLFWRAELYRYSVVPVAFGVNAFLLNLFALGLAFGTVVAVGMLFYQQVRIILRNKTGIEQWIVDKAEDRMRDEDEPPFIYPYDMGTYENVGQIVNWKCRPIGDGYSWPVVAGCTQYTLSIEQLKQKKEKRERMVTFVAHESYSGRWLPVTKGLKTTVCLPISDEPRIPLSVGDYIDVSRGNKYWLYGDKKLSRSEVTEGRRVRGWFPRRCVTKLTRNMSNNKKQN